MKKYGTIQKSIIWSSGAEIAAKFVTPISNMILARVLTPNDFGVLAICNMIISFIDLITDAGFGKYLVQHDFSDEEQLDQCANVSFWSNLALSVAFWMIVVFNRVAIARALGGAEYATVIAIACVQLIFTSMVSVQMSLLRRHFEFKKLFKARICVALVPIVLTVPLAIATKSYWSLIVGNIMGAAANAIVLSLNSKWRPRFIYSFELLKQMFSFSFWTLCEALAHWLIFWVDTFIVGNSFSKYYLGIYKNSANMIMALIGMITASLSPVLFSVLSRIKDNREFYSIFLHIEKIVAYLLFPIGIGVFFYRDVATTILFGNQWGEAANIIGAWALMMTASVVVYSFPAEAFKAKGVPKVLFFYQLSYLVILVPVCIVSAKINFWVFVYARAATVIIQAILCLIFLKIVLNWEISNFLKNLFYPFVAGVFSATLCITARLILPDTLIVNVVSIVVIAGIYAIFLLLFLKKDILASWEVIKKKEF